MKKRLVSLLLTGAVVCQLLGCGISAKQETQGSKEQKTEASKEQEKTETRERGKRKPQGDSETFEEAYLNFAFETLKASEEPGKNIMISPLSIMTALTMTANGAKGETLAQMESVLYDGLTLEEVMPELLAYIEHLSSTEDAQLKQANSIWIKEDEKLHVQDSFLRKNVENFGSEVYQETFDQDTLDEINQWVDYHTDGMIPSVLNQIDEDAIMYLINAIAFDAKWMEVYEEYQMRENQVFTREDGTEEKVTMMRSSESGYLEDKNTIGFVKPYKEGYSFVALLPKEEISMEDYLESFSGETWESLMKKINYKPIVVAKIPQFSSDYSIQMADVLENMGMSYAFNENLADFSDLGTYDDANIYISEVIHKTHITLDQNGTKAAAVTAVIAEEACAACPDEQVIKEVYLDRPFVYAIIDNENKLPIFVGVTEQINE